MPLYTKGAEDITHNRHELHRLQGALMLYRRGELTADSSGKAKSTNLPPYSCTYPRRTQVTQATLEVGPIVCRICDEEFAAIQGSELRV